jgi:hypothetical protein
MPNIAIDAMTVGTPVLCFENATGLAEILARDDETATCILPFLSVRDAASKIIDFYRSPECRALMSQRMQALAKQHFDMQRYVAQLVDIAEGITENVCQQKDDVAALQGSDEFLSDFYLPRTSRLTREDTIRAFVKSCQSQIYTRKPAPGFYPHLYVKHHDLTRKQVNPFVHFIQAGRPAGPWQEPVINISDEAVYSDKNMRVAVHIHAFYPNLLGDIISRLAINKTKCDLFISVTSDSAAKEVRNSLAAYNGGSCDVRIVPNRGRDIGPLLTEFAADLLPYDVVGHFHTKKSTHVVGSNLVRDWVEFLAENLLGGKHHAVDRILLMFAQNPKLGLVFADDPHLIGWDKNKLVAERLAGQIGIDDLPDWYFPFPVGTMFWVRPQALKPLLDLQFAWKDYPEEPIDIDGSMLHALERLLPTIVKSAGFDRMVTYVPGVKGAGFTR